MNQPNIALVSPGSPEVSSEPARPRGETGHTVQFYENDHFLATAVTDFLADGLAREERLVVIATESNRHAFATRLRARGHDVDHATRLGQLTMLDARETLSMFMIGAAPDRQRFMETIGAVIDNCRRPDRLAGVRLYGEMVDQLWRDRNTDGAIQLEELWNHLADSHTFNLLCAYSMGNFYKASDAEKFRAICAHHSHVVPAELYTEANDQARPIEVSRLQQQARALQTEIIHREDIERRLREVLAAAQRSEEALRESERELRDFLDNAAEGMHWVGPDGIILWANRAELELVGYTADEYVGRHIADFHADPVAIEDVLARLARNETLREYEATLRCKDGSVKHVLINSNVRQRDGKFVHTRCFTRDITELRRAALEREELLAREKAARAEAEAANRVKGEFLATMSHELRTPLNAILGYAELVEIGIHGPITDGQRRALERLRQSGQHLLELINDVLSFAKIEAGVMQYEITPVGIDELLASIETLVAPQIAARRVHYRHERCDPALAARADAEKVKQIVLNLVGNAIKFTPMGGEITLLCAADDGSVHVQVRDTGIGILADKLEAIFGPFVQIGRQLNQPGDGAGLGLAISREMARAMGGDILVESTVGQGSTFTLRLPAA